MGRVVILLGFHSKKQRHYTGHRHPVISVATNGDLCASGEYSPRPELRVWQRDGLKTVSVLNGHRGGIHLIRFLWRGLIVSCGTGYESAVLIHDI